MPRARVPGYVAIAVHGGAVVPRRVAEPIPLYRRTRSAREPIHTRERFVVQPGRCAAARLRDSTSVSIARDLLPF